MCTARRLIQRQFEWPPPLGTSPRKWKLFPVNSATTTVCEPGEQGRCCPWQSRQGLCDGYGTRSAMHQVANLSPESCSRHRLSRLEEPIGVIFRLNLWPTAEDAIVGSARWYFSARSIYGIQCGRRRRRSTAEPLASARMTTRPRKSYLQGWYRARPA